MPWFRSFAMHIVDRHSAQTINDSPESRIRIRRETYIQQDGGQRMTPKALKSGAHPTDRARVERNGSELSRDILQ
jgi:hypothetical protein